MNCIIPWRKEVKFNTRIAEIESISLEQEYTVNKGNLLGNFTISGEYKTHEISVNKEHFEFILPFSVELSESIKEDTLSFEIEDFTYDLVDNEILKIDIDYKIKAEEEEENIFERVLEENKEEEKNIEDETTIKDERLDIDEVKEEIVNNMNYNEDTYVTYNIHIVKEQETVESIALKYNTSASTLENYNDLSNINIGDKIIIPVEDE